MRAEARKPKHRCLILETSHMSLGLEAWEKSSGTGRSEGRGTRQWELIEIIDSFVLSLQAIGWCLEAACCDCFVFIFGSAQVRRRKRGGCRVWVRLDGDAKASSMPGCSLMAPVGRSAQLCSGPVMPSVEVKLDLIHLVLTVWSAPFLCVWVNGVASNDALPYRHVCIYRVNMDGLNFLSPVLLIDPFHQAQQTPSLCLLYPGNLVTLETSILFPETFMVFCLVTL